MTDKILPLSNFRITRRAACLGMGAVFSGAATRYARAEDWPTRPVTVVVPYSPGGNTDMMARLASQYMSDKLGQSFVVENRAGGGGALGAVQVARAQPDGYTFLFGASTQIINIPLMEKVSYDPEKDFMPVSIFGAGPYLLGVRSSLPVNTLQELVNYAKARPGKLNYSTAGAGGSLHLNTQMFLSRAGLDMVAIPYKGGAPAMAALVAGDVDMYFGNASELMAQGDNERIKILAVSTPQRLQQLPNVPTVAETFPGYDASSWNGFFAPTGTPKPIVDRMARETIAASKDKAIQERLRQLAILPWGCTPEEFSKVIETSRVANAQALKGVGISMLK